MQASQTSDDWSGFRGAYEQVQRMVRDHDGADLPEDIYARLAQACLKILRDYPGREAEFTDHAIAIIGEVEGRDWFEPSLVASLYQDQDFLNMSRSLLWARQGRWQPTPVETIIETLRRIRDLNQVRDALKGIGTSAVPGGSVVFGPFYNVHGNTPSKPASDIDLVLVVKDATAIVPTVDALFGVAGTDADDVGYLRERAQEFVTSYDNGRTIFSHRLPMWAGSTPDPMMDWVPVSQTYGLSLHILTMPLFADVIVDSSPTLQSDLIGRHRTLEDFRQPSAASSEHGRSEHLRTFAGHDHHPLADRTPTEVRLGVIVATAVYYIDQENRYCPGLLQCVLLTPEEPYWDDLDIRGRLARFREKIWGRLADEQSRSADTHLQLSLALVRREFFAPHVRRRIDEDPRHG